jgi:hypothetical protein
VVGEPDAVEAQLLRPGGEADQRLLRDQLRVVGMGDQRIMNGERILGLPRD